MHTIFMRPGEGLSREILFKPVIQWIEDAAAQFGLALALSDPPDAAAAFIERPVIFSPLLEGEDEGVRRPAGECLIPWGCLPAGTNEEIQEARRVLKDAILRRHIENGVDIVDPATTFIGPDVQIGAGTTILPGVVIRGRVFIGEGCELGPFTHIRSDVSLDRGVRAGAFVELKNSRLGTGSQAGHLTYVGDSDVGERVNFGCGTVTVNYDGARKFRTVIENDAFIGCNTNLVAPVTVGEKAFTAAGSTITEDVPPGALGIARARQTTKEAWRAPKDRQTRSTETE